MEIFYSSNYQFRKFCFNSTYYTIIWVHTRQYKSKTNSFSCSGLVEFTFEVIHAKNFKHNLKRK